MAHDVEQLRLALSDALAPHLSRRSLEGMEIVEREDLGLYEVRIGDQRGWLLQQNVDDGEIFRNPAFLLQWTRSLRKSDPQSFNRDHLAREVYLALRQVLRAVAGAAGQGLTDRELLERLIPDLAERLPALPQGKFASRLFLEHHVGLNRLITATLARLFEERQLDQVLELQGRIRRLEGALKEPDFLQRLLRSTTKLECKVPEDAREYFSQPASVLRVERCEFQGRSPQLRLFPPLDSTRLREPTVDELAKVREMVREASSLYVLDHEIQIGMPIVREYSAVGEEDFLIEVMLDWRDRSWALAFSWRELRAERDPLHIAIGLLRKTFAPERKPLLPPPTDMDVEKLVELVRQAVRDLLGEQPLPRNVSEVVGRPGEWWIGLILEKNHACRELSFEWRELKESRDLLTLVQVRARIAARDLLRYAEPKGLEDLPPPGPGHLAVIRDQVALAMPGASVEFPTFEPLQGGPNLKDDFKIVVALELRGHKGTLGFLWRDLRDSSHPREHISERAKGLAELIDGLQDLR